MTLTFCYDFSVGLFRVPKAEREGSGLLYKIIKDLYQNYQNVK